MKEKLIESKNIEKLFRDNAKKGQVVFPELIKRLIRATVNSNAKIRGATGDSTYVPGFDIVVEDVKDVKNSFVTAGQSVWECGTEEKYKKKIEEDFEIRTQSAMELDKSHISFILCTPYIWNGDTINWETSKNNLGVWKNVRIFDAIILADWLNENIEVSRWLLEQFNQDISLDIDYLSGEFERMCSQTKPKLNSQIMLCSNEKKSEEFLLQIKDFKGIYVTYSPVNFEQGYLFVLASLSANDVLQEKTIIVKSQDGYDWVRKNCNDKIIVVAKQGIIEQDILKNNTYIFITCDEMQTSKVRLNYIQFSDYQKAIETMGMTATESYDLSFKTNRNISCLKRRLAVNPLIKKPKWAEEDSKNDIIPISLLSEINLSSDYDREIVEKLSEVKFEEYIEKLDMWLTVDDSPVFKLNNIYKIYSKEEAVQTLRIAYNSPKAIKIEEILKDIAKVKDEIYDKPVKEWYIRDKQYQYSRYLVNGCLDSLAIFSNQENAQVHYDKFVKGLLDIIKKDIKLLHTFASYFTAMAEVSASAMIEYVINAVDSNDVIFKEFAETSYGVMFSKHSNLIYVISMLSQCLMREECVRDALRALLKIYYRDYDCGLKEQFTREIEEYFAPFTSMNIAIKPKDKIELLLANSKKENVLLTEKIIGKARHGKMDSWVFSSQKPQWKTASSDNVVTWHEIFEVDKIATQWLIENKSDKVALINDLLGNDLYNPPYDRSERIINTIIDDIVPKLTEEEKVKVNYNVLALLVRFKFYKKADEEHKIHKTKIMKCLKKLYNDTLATDVLERYRYVFERPAFEVPNFEEIDDETRYDWKKANEKKVEFATKVVGEILKVKGEKIFSKLLPITNEDNFTVQQVLFNNSKNHTKDMKILLDNKQVAFFLRYIAFGNQFTKEMESLILELTDNDVKISTYKGLATFINSEKLHDSIIKFIDGSEYEEVFWSVHIPYYNLKNVDDKLFNKLLEFCPSNLLVVEYREKDNLDIEKCFKIFDAIIKKDINKQFKDRSKVEYLSQLIDRLDKQQHDTEIADKLAMYELAFLTLLMNGASRHDDYPNGLKDFFWRKPNELFNLLKFAYNDNTKIPEGYTTIYHELTMRSLYVFGSRCFIPAGYMNTEREKFKIWFNTILDEAQKEPLKVKRDMVRMLVNTMAICPEIEDQTVWPNKQVAELLEECLEHYDISDIQQREGYEEDLPINYLASQFYCAKSNSQNGMRSVGDGSFELIEYERYMSYSKQYSGTHPTTALALKWLADSYKNTGDRDKMAAILGNRYDW